MEELYIDKVLNGDIDAFRYFVQKYKDKAFNIALSILKSEYDAKDAMQEAFVIAFSKLNSYQAKSSFSTWFYRILINESLKLHKKNKSQPIDIGDSHDIGSQNITEDFYAITDVDQQRFYIDKALKAVSYKEALALTLFYLEEYSINEISSITGWTISNTKVLLSRGRKSLYLELNRILKTEAKQLY